MKDPNGKRISKVIDNISMAKKYESKLKTKILESSLLGIKTVPIIDEVWPKYLEWAKDAKKSWKDDEMRWEYHVESPLTEKKMDKITGFDVQRVISYGLVQAYSQVKEKRSKSFCPFLCSHFSSIFSDIA